MKMLSFASRAGFLLIAVAISFQAQAFSCRRIDPTVENLRADIAYKKYAPPFGWFMATSVIGSAYGYQQLKNKEADGKYETWEFEDNLIPVMLAVGVIVSAQGDCPIRSDLAIDEATVKIEELDLEKVRARKSFYWSLHFFWNSLPLVGAAAFRSQKSDRWQTVGAAVIAPFAMDFLLRATFYRESVSPWTFRPGLFGQSDQLSSGLVAEYSW